LHRYKWGFTYLLIYLRTYCERCAKIVAQIVVNNNREEKLVSVTKSARLSMSFDVTA